jgi:cell division protease FtsH
MSNSEENSPEGSRRTAAQSPNQWIFLILIAILVFVILLGPIGGRLGQPNTEQIAYSVLLKELKRGNVASISFTENEAIGVFRDPPQSSGIIDRNGLFKDHTAGAFKSPPYAFVVKGRFDDTFSSRLSTDLQGPNGEIPAFQPLPNQAELSGFFLFTIVIASVLLVVMVFLTLRRSQGNGGLFGGGFLTGFTRSLAKRYDPGQNPITFKDVAGLESVKGDLLEIVEFLRDPRKFQKLGGRVPKGVLLSGPPGTGKTLLARAIAGEAAVPFFSVNGSEFIQMFVGVGATRVRDLFRTAKDASPAIIFVDEIDAVGRQRGAGFGGGHDEREQTLNQILGEMDGFSPTEMVIVIAATNRPDVLDPALLRPGRFDRNIVVDRPTQKGRVELFKIHSKHVPLSDDVDLERFASACMGMTGADIRNLVNEAALWAARHNKAVVSKSDFEYARDKVMMGAKREEVITPEVRETTAYHEAGHALIAWLLPGNDRLHKVTIVPRGRALGVTWTMPNEEIPNVSKADLCDRLAMVMGGRAAELIIYNKLDTGASSDLTQATSLARRMVTRWGMSDKVGPVSFKLNEEDPFLGRELAHTREFSEHTLQVIDEEVRRLLDEAAERAKQVLLDNRGKLEKLTQALLASEEIDEVEIAAILGPSIQSQMEAAKKRTQGTDDEPKSGDLVPNPA